ncbi:Mur ligase [Polychytrium aggregatum]|uniref:Mur ligase n=1 Tax=Polychytrium aggregatum TaxID=110093 RepID=UPI0022FE5D58|nr:Mur ligase [Polychytrium aggregatum]KAI9208294.1 Mur ligase [Polychytrium aggregatum]
MPLPRLGPIRFYRLPVASAIRLAVQRSMSSRSYADAVNRLNNLQSNAATLEAIRKAGNSLNLRNIPEMTEFLERIGHKVPELNKLNVIHIAGTKGKGSTSAFCESIMRGVAVVEDGSEKPLKTGLYTSPHLLAVRERIRINGVPISEAQFTKYFFQVWDALEATKEQITPGYPQVPVYFRCLTLLAFHVFLSEGVDVCVLEVGIGGKYDATNLIERPVVCGITSLGMDHVPLLGTTIGEIAWNKAGIIKPGVPVYSVNQPKEALETIESVSKENNGGNLDPKLCSILPLSSIDRFSKIKLGLAGEHQKINASLAVALCRRWIQEMQASGRMQFPLPYQRVNEDDSVFDAGLELARWPGRAQTFVSAKAPGVQWYLDGAHTNESLSVCADWFKQIAGSNVQGSNPHKNILIFNCTNGREGLNLLKPLAELVTSGRIQFSRVIFSTNDAFKPGSNRLNVDQINNTVVRDAALGAQKKLIQDYKTLVGSDLADESSLTVSASFEEAVDQVLEFQRTAAAADDSIRVLVTGSLHLIGACLSALEAEVQ